MKNYIVESYNKMQEVYSPIDQSQAPEMDYDEPVMAPNDEGDQVDTITLDVPLMIRMVEMGREELQDDETLHQVIANMISASNMKDGAPLTMDDYDSIIQGQDQNFKQEPGEEY